MAEAVVPVQPIAAPQPAASPLQLKFFFVAATDQTGAAITAAAQGVVLVDDQGRAYQAMTEKTGAKLVKLLDRLLQVQANANGSFYTPDMAGPDADG